jgi:multicomponent K+:H+ antiporter subunit E
MKRWLPFPLLSALLLAMWVLLNQSLAFVDVLFGAILALSAALAFSRLQPPRAMLRRPRVAFLLAALVLVDIVRSNIAVARIILTPGSRERTSGFVTIPLELSDPAGLAALACIITATPGTAWARYDSTRSAFTIHVLDLIDETTWIRTVKDRYERRLLEIFQ